MLDCMNLITLESCHSTWIFDARQLRFCRIVRGTTVGQRRISTEWRPYRELEIDPPSRSFTIVLNESRSRLISSTIHTSECVRCGSSHTTELSLEDIGRAVA
jgi:hypothetical protein